MSRTRIVKGSVTKIVGKSYKIYSKENIENYSAKKIIQVGKEGGVLYGEPETPPEIPIVYGEAPILKGEVIFCNGFHSGTGGAIDAAFNVTVGMEEKPWYLSDGENTHHKSGEDNSDLHPSDLDKDIMNSSDILEAEGKPQEEYVLGFDWKKIPITGGATIKKKDTSYKEALKKFKGYWNDYRNFGETADLYTTYFNAEKRDSYINGSHGMGSPAWERECHAITLGYHWAVKNWKLKTKEEVEKEKEKNPNAESYSPAYRPLTFVGHSEGAAVAVGACIGAMYYAAERGWEEMAVNLVLLGIHQPVSLWSEEKYDKNREQVGKYMTDYNTYKWFKTEVLEVGGNSPRILQEIYNTATKVEHAITPFAPALAHVYTQDRNKHKYGIDEWTAQILGTDGWNKLKKRAVQFTFSNDRADTVMIDGDIPGIANANGSEDDSTLFGWKNWTVFSMKGGLTPNSDYTINITGYDKGCLNTRILVNKQNPENVTYLKTTYSSWCEEFCKYHEIFKKKAVGYEIKYKEEWETGEVYIKEENILLFADKAMEYAKVADSHTEMMARYVWMHHVELEAHFAPVGYINRPEIFNLPDGKTRNPDWPMENGRTIWDRILKASEDNDRLFYRVDYDIKYFNRIYNDKSKDSISEDYKKIQNEFKFKKEFEANYVKNLGATRLINPKIAFNTEVEKWVNIAKLELNRQDEEARKEKRKLEREWEKATNPWPVGPKY
ncbi:hypothetical protein [Frigoriflavimonas asaccharolytica]|uniref:Uncharacterized protein n=2 Tax=Frigoriflavimonas asaccharolytica TaxID=2735899 RepID=A0A8J8K9F6_9FLAO|nr:hypothetical protein [Frigoriflavimonas asaccharolytica]NRS93753.1 hypothetical protein [Frigoriflavimonas asaccharolytica]